MTQQTLALIDQDPETEGVNFSNAQALLGALRHHYIGPETLPGGVFLTEVQVPDGNTMRRADGVYLCFTRSAGIGIDVCEVKVSRADFMRELDQPRKAEAWWNYSSRFWIVSPHPDVTPPDLMPEGWGLMCPKKRGRRFQVHRPAAVRQPQVDLTLLIELAKRLDTLRAQAATDARREADYQWQQKLYGIQRDREERTSALTEEQREGLAALAEIEKLAGVRLVHRNSWRPSDLTEEQFARALRLAARFVGEQGEAAKQIDHLQRLARSVQNVTSAFAETVNTAAAAHTESEGITTP